MQTQLLSELVECGECGRRYSASRSVVKKKLKIGIERVYQRNSYGCNSRITKRMHSKENAEKCTNKTVYTHILERQVFELLREFATDHKKLKECMWFFKQKQNDHEVINGKIDWLDTQIATVEKLKLNLVNKYASGGMLQDEYIDKNSKQDKRLNNFKTKRDKLIAGTSLLHNKSLVEMSVQKFCDGVKAQSDLLKTFDDSRQFLIKHVEKVVYDKYHVIVHGSVPVSHNGKIEKLPFLIDGHIDTTQLHRGPRQQFLVDGRLKEWGAGGRDIEVTKARKQELQSPEVKASFVTQHILAGPTRDSIGYTVEGRKRLEKVRGEAKGFFTKSVHKTPSRL